MLAATPTPKDIFQGHFFVEPLVPIGADPTPAENAALVTALQNYSRRIGPDDFSSLTGFLEAYPSSRRRLSSSKALWCSTIDPA
jgi:hypothetical protein